jgi:hypothetical protein
MFNLDRIYSVRKRKSHHGKDCYAVIVTLPSYEDGVFVEIGGYPVKWVFLTEAQAYTDCERRVQEDKLAGTQSCIIPQGATGITHKSLLDDENRLIIRHYNTDNYYVWFVEALDENGCWQPRTDFHCYDKFIAALAGARIYYHMEIAEPQLYDDYPED